MACEDVAHGAKPAGGVKPIVPPKRTVKVASVATETKGYSLRRAMAKPPAPVAGLALELPFHGALPVANQIRPADASTATRSTLLTVLKIWAWPVTVLLSTAMTPVVWRIAAPGPTMPGIAARSASSAATPTALSGLAVPAVNTTSKYHLPAKFPVVPKIVPCPVPSPFTV
ncbi:hypothetical protein Phage2-1_00038 [Achromobacter phage 2-1]|nr:hypothetical protein Phage2-1_00038 [Achromobacter phage 2-1]